MTNLLSLVKKYLLSFVSISALLAVLGVGYFDTYPTYLAKNVTLSESECSQVAVLVGAWQYKRTNPEAVTPEAAQKEMDKATRLAKRVAKHIIEKSQIPEGVPAGYLYQNLLQSCLMSDGKAELK